MHYKSVASLFAASLLTAFSGLASGAGLSDQWYVGVGGGASLIQADPVVTTITTDEDEGVVGTLFIGRDFDSRLSGQLQFSSFGEAELSDGSTLPYNGIDAAALYRFVDSRAGSRRDVNFGISLYGRVGLGIVDRDTSLQIRGDTPVGLSGGAGLEFYLGRYVAVRAEAVYHAEDLASATISLVGRFGGTGGLNELPPVGFGNTNTSPRQQPQAEAPTIPAPTTTTPEVPIPETDIAAPDVNTTVPTAPTEVPRDLPSNTDKPTTPESSRLATPSEAPATGPTPEDRDGDGVPNADDVCLRSAPGFPVRTNGCPVLDGVLSGIRFADGSGELLPESFEQLDFLVELMSEYPQARIELLSHTDNRGTVRDQSIITRARLRSVGTYLVNNGVRSNRLVLRSFGGTRPLWDNTSEDGRALNNRIEVLEKIE